MVFGYTILDPLVVVFGTLLALWYLHHNRLQLIAFMPTALSVWFFVPTITNLTLWQTVPLLLTGRAVLMGGVKLPPAARPVLVILLLAFVVSVAFALLAGTDLTRTAIRVVYYLGLLALFGFAYEMGRMRGAYGVLLKGLVIMGVVYAAYGAYQIIAFYTGLPVRGIVYDASGTALIPFEHGFPRINSLANEPKRLGYLLLLSAIACVFFAKLPPAKRATQLRWVAAGILLISIFTFAGSYFLALAFFGLGLLVVYPSRATGYVLLALVAAAIAIAAVPNLGVYDALFSSYERRAFEIERGLDNDVVYRQEFFAWDYLVKNPIVAITGVGVGRYFSVLYSAYGPGVGMTEGGVLVPLNSGILELIFELGGIATAILYGGLVVLMYRLRSDAGAFWCICLLFLIIQSFTILVMPFIALFSGLAMGRLAVARAHLRLSTRRVEWSRELGPNY